MALPNHIRLKSHPQIVEIRLAFQSKILPGALDVDPKARVHVRHEVRVEPGRIVGEVIICAFTLNIIVDWMETCHEFGFL